MSDVKLGHLIDANALRDAVHVAIAPVIAGEYLRPGQHVGFVEASTDTVATIADGPRGLQNTPAIGIVDPFLTVAIKKGQRFWLFLYPNTITSLRHDWTHSAFGTETPDPTVAARHWIEGFAAQLDQTYSRLMGAAERWIIDEEYTRDDAEMYKGLDESTWRMFWTQYEIVTGTKVKDHEASFFTCSC